MIYIYSNSNSNRLTYTLEVLFKSILKVEYSLVSREVFQDLKNVPKINYCNKNLPDCFLMRPHTLLFETDIHHQNTEVTHQNGIPYFFKTTPIDNTESTFSFDVFASTFYMVSRYEEYLPFTADSHARFSAKESLAYKANFLQIPVVHLWANVLKQELSKLCPLYEFQTLGFSQLNTLDIDVAYAYLGKPFYRHLGGFFKSLVQFDFRELKTRLVYYFTGKDPYDTYAYLEQMIQNKNLKTLFFIQMGKYGTFDKNIPAKKPLQLLLKKLSKMGTIGIHPSYYSNKDQSELAWEIKSLENTIGHPITNSRQHFLKLSFPTTYENLITQNITTDYTMGYADEIGFRAGICVAYPFFNLEKNEKRPLLLIPFQVMDGTLKDYLSLSPDEAVLKIREMKKSVENVSGIFVSIFHNSSLSDHQEWKNWRQVFEELIGQ